MVFDEIEELGLEDCLEENIQEYIEQMNSGSQKGNVIDLWCVSSEYKIKIRYE